MEHGSHSWARRARTHGWRETRLGASSGRLHFDGGARNESWVGENDADGVASAVRQRCFGHLDRVPRLPSRLRRSPGA